MSGHTSWEQFKRDQARKRGWKLRFWHKYYRLKWKLLHKV